MNEKGLMEQSNAAIKAALELYAADHGKLNDGDSFTTKLNNCVLTISLKDGSLTCSLTRTQTSRRTPRTHWT